MDRKTISIVTPCFNEEGNVKNCYKAVKRLFDNELAAYDREHIFCDNASTDKTPEILREIASADPAVKVIINSRNFGVFRSMFNGMLNASGDAVVPMLAADLQDPPHVLVDFVRLWAWAQREIDAGEASIAEKAVSVCASRIADTKVPIREKARKRVSCSVGVAGRSASLWMACIEVAANESCCGVDLR